MLGTPMRMARDTGTIRTCVGRAQLAGESASVARGEKITVRPRWDSTRELGRKDDEREKYG